MIRERARQLSILAALGVLYTVWGSTYLAQRVAVTTLPPLWMASARFFVAGLASYGLARALGAPTPTRAAWQRALASSVPLLVLGMGTAAMAVKRVPSGLVALVFATVPLWTALFGAALGDRLQKREIAGLLSGFLGVALVALRGSLRAEPVGLALAAGAAASYALGCCVTRKLPIAAPVAPTDTPRAALAGAFLGPSLQMIVGGPLLGVYALATGERLTQAPSLASVGAVAYLVVLGSVLAYSALAFLLQHAPPALATSYAYVNPPVALALGAAFGSETIRAADVFGLALVLVGVVLLLTRVLPTEARRAMQVSSAARDQIDAPRRIG